MKRYDCVGNATHMTLELTYVSLLENQAGRYTKFEDVQALAKELLPYLQHTHRDCFVEEGVEPDECFCQVFPLRDKLKAIIEAKP